MSRGRYFEEQRSGNGAIYHCVKTEIEPGDKIRLFNADEDVDCITSATEKSSMYRNDSFFVFV